ncbi:sensor histidine kinase [Mucilaginibacter sp. FT3.2]|uniref:sensor histidine kinase n=1 Tax=Mucilaginibacter sp. FT3.2 TaxID=2723090 RepID=UPI00161A5A12|nr:HAMP domain-containing sensor histidine kinase [Mucilaginibacter sp. FT3.2]MBB6234543.1 signal transduction histidine kinase [Mucilaginibacter sp. FT3.2]
MKFKNRLSLQFTLLFAILLFCVLSGIYLFVAHNRTRTFFEKLAERANTVGQFYLAEDNLSDDKFKAVLKKFPQSLSDEQIRIYDDQFKPKFIEEGNLKWNRAVINAVIAQKRISWSAGNHQITGIYYNDNSGNFVIIVSATDTNGHHILKNLSLIMFFFFLASLVITFILGRVFSGLALNPIVKITNNLKTIRSTRLDRRLPVAPTKTDEIDVLSLTINQLLEHLEQSFESQKSFIANASHELRTPITTILGEAETTLMHDRGVDEYKLSLANIIKETERLIYLINSLMELMQTNISIHDFQNIRMDELIWEIKDELSGKSNESQITINYSFPDDPEQLIFRGNHQLLFVGISNIIKNGLKFSDHNEVVCDLYCDAKGINILIRDKGIGIEQTDLTKIFDPFFRAPNALKYAGYGIGLSLTNNIIRLHNGTISIKSQVGIGTEFHLLFPY